MKEGQDAIYYITAESYAAAANSRQLEIFRKKGREVLSMSDRVHEWMVPFPDEYDGTKQGSVANGGLDLDKLADEEEKQQQSELAESMKPLVERLQKSLGEKVKEVRVTARLVDSPACVVVDAHELSPYLRRMLKAAGQQTPESKPIL